ncbi:hypothetical protein [Alloyangia mangrovi]|nr:hypothetical protein [Alloyangia mangrovi]
MDAAGAALRTGWGYIFSRHVTQADKGCDFDFLERYFGRAAGDPDIF